ncbi:hypothetical protein NC651_024992 [Populus alba x Populus x berolinensis]|nr:hypothetical protein NC651_024992 [Populus alba x Populus x berolinensis]
MKDIQIKKSKTASSPPRLSNTARKSRRTRSTHEQARTSQSQSGGTKKCQEVIKLLFLLALSRQPQ